MKTIKLMVNLDEKTIILMVFLPLQMEIIMIHYKKER